MLSSTSLFSSLSKQELSFSNHDTESKAKILVYDKLNQTFRCAASTEELNPNETANLHKIADIANRSLSDIPIQDTKAWRTFQSNLKKLNRKITVRNQHVKSSWIVFILSILTCTLWGRMMETQPIVLPPGIHPRTNLPPKSDRIGSSWNLTPASFDQLKAASQKFQDETVTIPTEANQLAAQPATQKDTIAALAAGAHPVMHYRVLEAAEEFLTYWRVHGSAQEKALYSNMTAPQFIDRLLNKRPLMFMTAADSFLLRDGTAGMGGFELIGTPFEEEEEGPLMLQDYLSYKEMELSALLSVSTPTYFINTGGRFNYATPEKDLSKVETTGVYQGLVGARFERPGLMDWKHMIVTADQNTVENGYGASAFASDLTPFAKLYQQGRVAKHYFPTYADAVKDKSGNFVKLPKTDSEGRVQYLNVSAYKERMRLVIETSLIDSDTRAAAEGKKAYLHAVGLGLGVWEISPIQQTLLIEVYGEILTSRPFPNIADVDFSYFKGSNDCLGVKSGQFLNDAGGHKIKIHFSKRDPAEKLQGDDAGKLLVAQYAWDGNSFPGNEYWMSSLDASGDPAAACCSGIAELQNPMINPAVCGDNTHIAR